MNDHHPEISKDRLFFFARQEVIVDDFYSAGYILDIGGGGEGVIGKLKGKQVIAIDPNRRELEEAAAGPLKIVMDATDLQFLDGTFSTTTSFFTLMYIKGSDHEQVFGEVYRVLAPGGRFLIWDVVFPPEKSFVLDYPPVDRERFNGEGEAWDIPRFQRGRYNGVMCDSWRADSDILEIAHGAIEASRRIQGLTWHVFAINEPVGPFRHIFQKMRSIGALGTIGGRRGDMEQVYRGADFILSGRRSISRVIAEALCCGTPVIASARGALYETMQGAAQIINTDNVQTAAKTVRAVLGNPAIRAKLVSSGLSKAREYSWKKSIEKTRKVYQHVIESHAA